MAGKNLRTSTVSSDAIGDGFASLGLSAGDDHMRAVFRQKPCSTFPDATACACHQRRFPGQIERVTHVASPPKSIDADPIVTELLAMDSTVISLGIDEIK